MDSNPGGNENPQPPPYGGDPSVPPYGNPSEPPYGAPSAPPYGGTPPPYGGTPPPYAPPGQSPPYQGQGGVPPYGFPAQGPARSGLNNKMLAMIGGGVAVVVVVVVLIVVLVGGGGNSPTSTVNGFISAVLANNGAQVCTFPVPSSQAVCVSHESSFTGATGSGTVVNQVVQGNEALVAVTGELCAPFITTSNNCESNSSASTGMPGNGVSFDQAYAAAVAANNSISPVPLQQINGKWYIG